MNRPVIVPLIEALFTARAVPLLVEIARRGDVAMHVVDLHPVQPAGQLREENGVFPSSEIDERVTLRSTRKGYLEQVAGPLSDVLSSPRVRTAVRQGCPEVALMTYAQEQDATLIFIAIENRHDAEQAATCALAERIAIQSGVPIFLIATNRGETRGTLISAMDGTERSRDGLQMALSVARLAGAGELLVQALPEDQITLTAFESDLQPTVAHARRR